MSDYPSEADVGIAGIYEYTAPNAAGGAGSVHPDFGAPAFLVGVTPSAA
jgi:hypothetical protein